MNPLDSLDITYIVQTAREQARTFNKDRLKTNQIRNFYSAIAQMRIKFQEAKKSGGDSSGYEAVKTVEASTDKNKAMENYFALIESVVGFHKYFGDK